MTLENEQKFANKEASLCSLFKLYAAAASQGMITDNGADFTAGLAAIAMLLFICCHSDGRFGVEGEQALFKRMLSAFLASQKQ